MKKLIILLFVLIDISISAQTYNIEITSTDTCIYNNLKDEWGKWVEIKEINELMIIDIETLTMAVNDRIKNTFKLIECIDVEINIDNSYMAIGSIDKNGKEVMIFIWIIDPDFCVIGIVYYHKIIYRYKGIIKKLLLPISI